MITVHCLAVFWCFSMLDHRNDHRPNLFGSQEKPHFHSVGSQRRHFYHPLEWSYWCVDSSSFTSLAKPDSRHWCWYGSWWCSADDCSSGNLSSASSRSYWFVREEASRCCWRKDSWRRRSDPLANCSCPVGRHIDYNHRLCLVQNDHSERDEVAICGSVTLGP